MFRRALPIVLAGAVITGCGGGGGGGGGSVTFANSPKGAVQAFTAAVGRGDWKAACKLVGPQGGSRLGILLHVDANTEQDQFGLLKDCPATLQKHAAGVRTVVQGADPGAVRQKSATTAVVSSPRGAWRVVIEQNSTTWQIGDFPASSYQSSQ